MKRDLCLTTMTEDYCPPWQCPNCAKGTLAIEPKSLIRHETAFSKSIHSEEVWEPDWIDYRFTAWAKCASCKQMVAISGDGSVKQEMVLNDYNWVAFFRPRFWSPMPAIIDVPENCPDNMKEALAAAFSLFASQRASCATRLRVALEFLMDYEGIRRRKKMDGKFVDLSLHKRLTAYTTASPDTGAQLMALKWLGNAGSHEAEVSNDYLLDAFEVFEHALAEIVGKRKQRVAKLTKALTKKFGRK